MFAGRRPDGGLLVGLAAMAGWFVGTGALASADFGATTGDVLRGDASCPPA